MRSFREGHRGTFVSEPSVGRTSGRRLFNVSRPLVNADGSLRGAVLISAYPKDFRERFARIAPALNYSAALVDKGGIFWRAAPRQ